MTAVAVAALIAVLGLTALLGAFWAIYGGDNRRLRETLARERADAVKFHRAVVEVRNRMHENKAWPEGVAALDRALLIGAPELCGPS